MSRNLVAWLCYSAPLWMGLILLACGFWSADAWQGPLP